MKWARICAGGETSGEIVDHRFKDRAEIAEIAEMAV